MAIINKIRENSGVAIIFIAIALILFIVGGDFVASSGGGGLFGGSQNKVGEINGTTVDYQQFAGEVEVQKMQFENSIGRSATEQEVAQIREQVWEKLIFTNVYLPEFENLGLTVSEDELREMIQGPKNIHPFVMQQFSDVNGNFDATTHGNFISAIATNAVPADQKAAWDNFKRELRDVRMREKYANLLNSSTYITKAEAKAEYLATTETASGKYLYVPFYSITDTTVKVSDSEIKNYYSNNKSEFTPFDNRAITYIAYSLLPTTADSLALLDDLRQLAKGLATAEDPIQYANEHSDFRSNSSVTAGELDEEVRNVLANSIVGSIVGPFKEGNSYRMHKFLGTETDHLYTARASHILFRTDPAMTAEEKAEVKEQAQEILKMAQTGMDFGFLASQYSEDGSAQNGGDLGSFQNNGMMVKPFEDAIFNYNGTGILPNLVETDFGYHIIKVTEAKSNLKYNLATITKELQVGDEELNNIYHQASELISKAKTVKELEELAKNDESLQVFTASNVAPGATFVNTLTNAKELVQWAYGKEAKPGRVADKVFELENYYVVAGLKSISEKSNPKAEDFKEMIATKIRNRKKAEQITKKLGDGQGDLNTIASGFGAGALVEEVENITFQTGMLNSAGFDPVAVGKLFGLKPNTRSKVFTGDSGVFIMESLSKNTAPEIADYTQYKAQIEQRSFGFGGMIGEEILKSKAKIEDFRARMF